VLVQQACGAGTIRQLLESLNGFYAICHVDDKGHVIAAVDRARSIPLFYATLGDKLFISDDANWVRRQLGANRISRQCATELLMAAFVTGPNTLFEEIKQLQLGEMLTAEWNEGKWRPRISSHYHYHHANGDDVEPQSQYARLEVALDAAAARLVDYAQGRQILLALSGGLDSTMIGVALRRLGCTNVRAFTYGTRYSQEVVHSRRVADALGYPWQCFEYSRDRWRSWLESDDRRTYWNRAHNCCSLPHVQDAMAVKGVLRSGFAAQDAVVVAGQSVESFYGVQFGPEDWSALNAPGFSPETLADIVYRLHYRLWPGRIFGSNNKSEMITLILESLGDPAPYGTPTSYFEAWVVREKDGKFNINSVRAYEHYGLDWWLPLFDSDIISFWTQLPSHLRHGRAFTRSFTSRYFASVAETEYDYRHGYSSYERAARRFRPMVWAGGLPAALYLALKRELKYNRDRMGWHQIISRQLYRRLFHFRFNINSLLVLEFLGALDLGYGGSFSDGLEIPPALQASLNKLVSK